MFFLFGINQNNKELEYTVPLSVHKCGKYANYNVFLSYYQFSVFFIPIFKWGKKYYIRYNCCNNLYEINKEVGKEIEHGKNPILNDSDLTIVGTFKENLVCENCGTICSADFDFCPKCGTKLGG